jgi:hypothetical protein
MSRLIAASPDSTSFTLAAARDSGSRTLRQKLSEYRPWIDFAREKSAAELQKAQQWEYNVVKVKSSEPAELTAALNKWGQEGWECFQIVAAAPPATGGLPTEYLLFLRRRPASWFSQIPYRDLLRMLMSLSDDSNPPAEKAP